MDIATLIGGVAGFALVVGSILISGSLTAFIDVPSILIVFGGTIAAGMMGERIEHVINSIKVALNALFIRSPAVENTIEIIVDLATVVRKEGLLALENRTIDDAFLARGVRFAVDGMPSEEVQAVLRGELASMRQRHKRGQKLFKFLAATAPSMGMIGTLIGLVQMLQTLDDPAKIGPAMAVALLTTFYGAILAFMIFGPLTNKLELRSTEEGTNMEVVITGIESIVRGENARVVQEKLEGFLAPANRSSGES
ncbi:MAG: MotA/TolQ/ExbB proton channel family protein [Myxococcales bacterium]|nr:MotA/TolQ/ExbB proton channel family protein [Myxococcales bacterium]